jgi:hypothetical protein
MIKISTNIIYIKINFAEIFDNQLFDLNAEEE